MHKDTLFFTNQLISWYLTYRRNLPWRTDSTPYHVWLSEIILQQTKVVQGLPYYNAFISKYPTIQDLAAASEEEVLLLWQGLGYYSRARNLHATAKYIVEKCNGEFPDNHKDLLKLKGVGDYTASAIASICYNEPQPVVDGNVYRLLSRVFGIETIVPSSKAHKEFKELGRMLMGDANPGIFNQAMMEFGALQCVPKNPTCDVCVFSSMCSALQKGKVQELPVKKKKAKIKNRYFNYFVINNGQDVIPIQRRMDKDIWYKLYQLPLIESSKSLTQQALKSILIEDPNFSEIDIESLRPINQNQIVHKLSHQHLHTKFWRLNGSMPHLQTISIAELADYAFPTLIDDFLATFLEKYYFVSK